MAARLEPPSPVTPGGSDGPHPDRSIKADAITAKVNICFIFGMFIEAGFKLLRTVLVLLLNIVSG